MGILLFKILFRVEGFGFGVIVCSYAVFGEGWAWLILEILMVYVFF